jgi:hypothetical protein
MYMTTSEAAISLYTGTLGAFMLSHGEQDVVPREPVLSQLRDAIIWLQENNPLIRHFGFGLEQIENNRDVFPRATVSIPGVEQEWDRVEADVPQGRHPDVVIDPGDIHPDVHNEDYRYHRLPAGVAFTARDGRRGGGQHDIESENIPFAVPHGDPDLEALLFISLYPNGKGAWHYTKRQVSVL